MTTSTYGQPTAPQPTFTAGARRVVFLTAIIGFIGAYAASQMSHTLPFARTSLDLSEGGMSAVFAGVRAASLVGVVFSLIADRSGRRRPLLGAFALVCLASLMTAFVPSLPAYVVSQAFVRIGVVAIAAISIVLIAEEVPAGFRALALGIYGLAGSMGVGFGLIVLPIAENSPDAWRLLFGFAGLGLLAFPLLNRFLPESHVFVAAPPFPFIKALGMGLNKHFWPLAGVSFFVAAFSSPAFDFVLERMINDLSWDTGAARFLLIVFSGAGTIGLLVGGRLADRIGRRPTSAAAIAIGLIGGIGFYSLDSGWFLASSIFLATFGATMLTPSLAAQRAELFPTRLRATAGGWITNIAIIGSIVGFSAGAFLIDRYGLTSTVALLGAGLIISILLVLRLPETKGLSLERRKASPSGANPQG
jgi:MFS family permease